VPVVVVIVILAMIAAAAVMVRTRRRPRQDDGMQSFRRHIDALSPEARREVHDRAHRHDEDRN
jgi:hypothetical protein